MRGRGDDDPAGLGLNGMRPHIDKPQSEPKGGWVIPLLVGMVLFVVVYLFMLLNGQPSIETRDRGLDLVPPGPPVPFPKPLAKSRD